MSGNINTYFGLLESVAITSTPTHTLAPLNQKHTHTHTHTYTHAGNVDKQILINTYVTFVGNKHYVLSLDVVILTKSILLPSPTPRLNCRWCSLISLYVTYIGRSTHGRQTPIDPSEVLRCTKLHFGLVFMSSVTILRFWQTCWWRWLHPSYPPSTLASCRPVHQLGIPVTRVHDVWFGLYSLRLLAGDIFQFGHRWFRLKHTHSYLSGHYQVLANNDMLEVGKCSHKSFVKRTLHSELYINKYIYIYIYS